MIPISSQVTFPVFILFSAMLTTKQYFGDPIDCLTVQGLSSSMINTYCWTHGTFTVKDLDHVTVMHISTSPKIITR